MIHHSSGGGSSATAAALPRALPAAGRLSRCRPFSLHPRWGPPWEQCVPSVQYNAESPSAAPTTPSPPTPALRGTPVPSAAVGRERLFRCHARCICCALPPVVPQPPSTARLPFVALDIAMGRRLCDVHQAARRRAAGAHHRRMRHGSSRHPGSTSRCASSSIAGWPCCRMSWSR